MVQALRYCAYYRVSTDRQGQSGLGLEAQRIAVAAYTAGRGSLVAEFVEVESGKRDDRPQLAAALALCRQRRAVLVIAKLDRLSRNLAFIANMMEAGVEFVACDMPSASRFTLHILAAVAEHERNMISERTWVAMTAAKARGVVLGPKHYNAPLPPQAVGSAANRRRAEHHAAELRDYVNTLRSAGVVSAAGLARWLNEDGIRAPRGERWHAPAAWRLLRRLKLISLNRA